MTPDAFILLDIQHLLAKTALPSRPLATPAAGIPPVPETALLATLEVRS